MSQIVTRILAATLAMAALPTAASDDVLGRATKLLEKRHYDMAAAALRQGLPATDVGRQGAALLVLGTAYLKSAELHRELAQLSLQAATDNLRHLSAAAGKERVRTADLFLGETLLAAGKPDAATWAFEKFLAERDIPPKLREIAMVRLGSASLRSSADRQKAENAWRSVTATDPEVKLELAAAYSMAGMQDRMAGAMAEEALITLRKSGKALPARALKNALIVYNKAGLVQKGLDLLQGADLRAASHSEQRGRTKEVSFYDAELLGQLAALYLRAAEDAFEKAAREPKYRETAGYLLAETHSLAGNAEQSSKALASVLSSAQVPKQLMDRAVVRQAANQYLKGKQLEAIGTWNDLIAKTDDPELLAEVLIACARLHVDCARTLQRAEAALDAVQGRKASVLSTALGRYYAARKDHAKALLFLERGRDKGNKNRIEANDPMLLVALADGYYRTKRYSEALEILFEMAKSFPEVRQVQESLQGIYSVNQKSAGDVKIN